MLALASASASAQSLVNGGSVSGSIALPGDQDAYTFSVQAGENVQLRIVDLNGVALVPRGTLYDPSGAYVTYAAAYDVAAINATAAMTGTYTLVLGDGTGSHTGVGTTTCTSRATLRARGGAVRRGGPVLRS